MSQVPPNSETPSPPKKSGGALRIVLIVILLAMLGLLAWDIYARNVSHQSFVNVQDWVDHELQEHSPADVQKLIGRAPDRPLEDKADYALETYSWPRGMLVNSYYVTVIYRKEGDKVLLHEVVKNTPPDANDLPNPPVAMPPTATSGAGEKPTTPTSETPADEPATRAAPAETESVAPTPLSIE